MTSLLEARDVVKHFGGVVALDGLDLSVERNEILGLIGPNGSGKTTFFNVVTGLYSADAGSVIFDGTDITMAPSRVRFVAFTSSSFQSTATCLFALSISVSTKA